MIESKVSKEMWQEWTKNPVTNAFMNEIRLRRENVKEYIANNGAKGEELQQCIGATRALADILNIEYQGDSEND